MKSLKFNKSEIVIVYEKNETAQGVYDWLHPLDQKRCTVSENVLTYDISDYGEENDTISRFYPLKQLLDKSIYDSSDISAEKYIGDTNDIYAHRINCFVGYDKVFRITPINEDGTLGTLDFGVHQYSNFISFILANRPVSEFVFLSDRCHVGDFEHHELRMDRNITILIEVATLQF